MQPTEASNPITRRGTPRIQFLEAVCTWATIAPKRFFDETCPEVVRPCVRALGRCAGVCIPGGTAGFDGAGNLSATGSARSAGEDGHPVRDRQLGVDGRGAAGHCT